MISRNFFGKKRTCIFATHANASFFPFPTTFAFIGSKSWASIGQSCWQTSCVLNCCLKYEHFCRFFRENVEKGSLRLTWDLMVETNLVIEAMFSRKIRRMKNFLKDFIIVVFLQWQRRVDFKVKPWKRWIDYENEKDFWTKNFVKLTQMLKISSKILHF